MCTFVFCRQLCSFIELPSLRNLVTVVGTESFNKFIALIPIVERALGISKDEVKFSAFCSNISSKILNYDLQPINTQWTDNLLE